MIKKLAAGLGALVIILVIVIALQPPSFQVERSIQIAAPPTTPFSLINNFHHWEQWSPWAKLDPAMETTYEGPESGVGAVYRWSGNGDVGEGQMTITESTPGEKIVLSLEFKKPFEAQNTTVFLFVADGNTTTLVWRMEGTNNFIGKAMGLVMNMDAMIGESFEQGLAELKVISETTNPTPAE